MRGSAIAALARLLALAAPLATCFSSERAARAVGHRQLRVRGTTLSEDLAASRNVAKPVSEPSAAEIGSVAKNGRSDHSQLRLAATQYYGLVHVGSPPQEFRVAFDTASGELILPGENCDDVACTSHRRFSSQNSTTAKQIGWADDPTKQITDGEDRDTKSLLILGSDVSGEFLRDTVCIGQLCGVADFVALMEEAEDPFQDLVFDGVMGLAPSSPDAKEFNVPQALFGRGLTGRKAPESVFAFYFSEAQPEVVAGGELHFGGYRQERMASEPVWAPIVATDSGAESWQIRVDDIVVGGKAAGACGESGCHAIVDTGSSLVMMPGSMLSKFLHMAGIDDDCTGEPASLAFVVNGQRLELHAEDYSDHGEGGCELLLATSLSSGKAPTLVLGYPFLRRYYTIFDLARRRVGFALARQGPTTPSTSSAGGAMVSVPLVGLRP